MKVNKAFISLCLCMLLLGITVTVSADPPEPTHEPFSSANETGAAETQPAKSVLDPNVAQITRLPLTEDSKPLPGNVPPPPSLNQDIGAAAQVIKVETFEALFPNEWELVDANGATGGDQIWTDVPCFAHTGTWAAWPAGPDGLAGVNPCTPVFAPYPPLVNSWLIYGPFSLTNAETANFKFYFRMLTEICNPNPCDYLFAGASIDGENFYGSIFWNDWSSGPAGNGYFFEDFDLTNVFTLGDLTGQPEVWIGIQFVSDDTVSSVGAYVDNITIEFEPKPNFSQVFLPILLKPPPQIIPKTDLYVFNNNNSSITYSVLNAELNGAPVGTRSCTIPAKTTRFCVTVDSKVYNLKFTGSQCTKTGNNIYLPPGRHDREARCPSSD
jgi:hypothetical protein